MHSYTKGFLGVLLGLSLFSLDTQACSRVLHTFKNGDVITGQSMDWYLRFDTSIWKFPRGIKRSGLTPTNPAKWVSKYGSVIISDATAAGEAAATDGINEKGLVGNMLYLTETQYAPRNSKKQGVAQPIKFAHVAQKIK